MKFLFGILVSLACANAQAHFQKPDQVIELRESYSAADPLIVSQNLVVTDGDDKINFIDLNGNLTAQYSVTGSIQQVALDETSQEVLLLVNYPLSHKTEVHALDSKGALLRIHSLNLDPQDTGDLFLLKSGAFAVSTYSQDQAGVSIFNGKGEFVCARNTQTSILSFAQGILVGKSSRLLELLDEKCLPQGEILLQYEPDFRGLNARGDIFAVCQEDDHRAIYKKTAAGIVLAYSDKKRCSLEPYILADGRTAFFHNTSTFSVVDPKTGSVQNTTFANQNSQPRLFFGQFIGEAWNNSLFTELTIESTQDPNTFDATVHRLDLNNLKPTYAGNFVIGSSSGVIGYEYRQVTALGLPDGKTTAVVGQMKTADGNWVKRVLFFR